MMAKDVFIPGIMEHVADGHHSGDSISVCPTFSVSRKAKDKIIDYTVTAGPPDRYRPVCIIQFILDGGKRTYM